MTSPTPDEPEVGVFSLWFLRGALLVTSLVVIGFGVHAVVGLFDGGGDDPLAAQDPGEGSEVAPSSTAPDTGGDDGGDGSGDGDRPVPTTTTVPSTATTAEVDAFVADAVAFIEAVRDRPFLEPPDLRVVGEDEFLTLLLADLEETFAEEPDLIERIDVLYQALGMIGANQSIEDVYRTFVEAGVLGVYFPDRDEMLVRGGGPLSLLAKTTIVHELVHAFDDQHFDLERSEDLDDRTELPWTFAAAVEGSARYVEDLWVETLTATERARLEEEELAFGDPALLASMDLAFLFQEISVYEYGARWIGRLVTRDGIGAIDDAVLAAAATSEQVMQPLDGPDLDPIPVPSPDVEGEVVWELAGGQVLIDSLLNGAFIAAPEAAPGWGGDAITAYRLGGVSCVRWDIATDSPTDAKELLDALVRWVEFRGSGQVEMVDGLVRLDRCA